VHLAWALALVLAVAGTWLATRVALTPPSIAKPAHQAPAEYTLTTGAVGQQRSVPGTVEFRSAGRATAGIAGTVTSIEDPHGRGKVIKPGQVLITVDLRPVVVASGTVPMFRELARGAEGPDVAQLRRFLKLGEGSRFDGATETALLAWQRRVGLRATGVLRPGEIVFVPDLPAPARVPEDLRVGDTITAGQVILEIFRPSPEIFVSQDAADGKLEEGMAVRADGAKAVGVLARAEPDAQGLQRFRVVGEKDAPLCDADCAAKHPAPGPSVTKVSVEIVKQIKGTVVPEAAILHGPDGTATLVGRDGQRIQVSVLAAADGKAVIDGAPVGTVVRLFPEGPG
jgi:hypothetical protein